MRFKLHRLAPNSEGWQRPSGGRLGQKGVGDYVHEHGFGHEDWNFNFDLATDGKMLGYTVARPAKEYAGEKFRLVLATYDGGGWRAAGYYDGAEFLSDHQNHFTDDVIQQMAVDVFELAAAGQAASKFRDMTMTQIEKMVRTDFLYFCWSVPRKRVHIFRQPLPIPKAVFNPGRQRMVTSFNLTKDQFLAISKLGSDVAEERPDREEEEGTRVLRVHLAREGVPSLVAEFKASLTSFACSACGFDFKEKYGELGAGFIECHHTQPIAKMKPGDKTKLSDLSAVCSNCHRMIHRSKPMLCPNDLGRIIKREIALE